MDQIGPFEELGCSQNLSSDFHICAVPINNDDNDNNNNDNK